MKTFVRAVIPAALLWMVGCAERPATDATSDVAVLHAAMQQLSDVMVYDIFSPPQASRVYAYASVAAYEAARLANPDYRSLAGQLKELTPAPAPEGEIDVPMAAVQALMRVGTALTFSKERMDSAAVAFQEQLRRRGVSRSVAQRSVEYGDAVGAHVLAWAAQDLYPETRGYPKYPVIDEPGRWIPTPPAYLDAIEPHWASLRTFVLDSASQFKPPPPDPYDMTEGSPFYEQAKEVWEVGLALTPEQQEIAAFWDCNPYVMHVRGHAMFATKKITPGGHWVGIIGLAARKAQLDLPATAELYASTGVALADAFISSWDEKYRSNLIRPETVINASLDESWQPLLQTPPFPEYTSGHSVISNAAAAVLTDRLGAEFAFADSTEMEYGLPVRSFGSFQEAAAEAAISRLYGGIHYRMAVENGITQGRAVGDLVVERVHTHPAARMAVGANEAP